MKVEFRGLENKVAEGAIIAAKHQSVLETFALTTQIEDFTYILKRELTLVPLFGWYLIRADQIAVNREKRGAAMADLTRQAKQVIAEKRSIFIFPEGTRRASGAPPKYKPGVGRLYAKSARLACRSL